MQASQIRGTVQWRRTFAILLAMAIAAPADAAARSKNRIRYDDGVRFVTDAELRQGMCLFVWGMMTAPDFFAGLERRETPEGPQFRRGSRVVSQFPGEMIVRVRMREFPCHVRVKQDEGPPLPELTLETMNSLRFEAQWKRGMRLRPVENLTLRTFFVDKDQPRLFVSMPAAAAPAPSAWNYEFVVSSENVPLTDHLILSVFAPDGRRLVRVSARL
jgi:hypothetical protein